MSDIVDRLRAMAGPIVPNVCTEAADEIERLRKERDQANEERDDARRQYCRGFTDFAPNALDEHLGLEDAAMAVAERFGWDCFKEAGK